MPIKPEIRTIAIDDGPLSDKVVLIGTIFRGADWLEGVLRSEIAKDGMDATEKMVALAKESKHYDQSRAILLDGVTYAGFNAVDIVALNEQTKLPIIVVMRSPPDIEKIREALTNLDRQEDRWRVIQKAGKIFEVSTSHGSVFIQLRGIDLSTAREIVHLTAIHSRIPEPLRVAHLIASGIATTSKV
ncbi:MAG: DUF99 family protein [Methanocellales archaeon]|nr:DUF99 family protein [Methanocellales archaeon]